MQEPDSIHQTSITVFMKHIALALLCLVSMQPLLAQDWDACKDHPLFTVMPDHSVRSCSTKEFDELEIYTKVAGSLKTEKKQGYKHAIQYKFDKDWNTRPATLQIVKNYVNAVKKAGGDILSETEQRMYARMKKAGDTYWVEVYADGSGDYYLNSIREGSMKQDITAISAEEIKGDIKSEGKAVFYGIYFDTDKSVIKPESAPTLTEIGKFLKGNPGMNVFIVGHTDNTGDFNHNMALSKARAEAVVNELVTKYGINKMQITAQGVAQLSPVAANDTETGKAKNRRVEIVKK